MTRAAHGKRRAFLAAFAAIPFSTFGQSASDVPEPTLAQPDAPLAQPDVPLAQRIARRYRVAPSAVERIIKLAERHFPADPTLLLAIVGVESSWRPWAVGTVGEVGLCQVRPDLHGASETALADPAVNIRVASRVLRQCLARSGGDVAAAVARYNGRGPAADEYARRVLEERERLIA